MTRLRHDATDVAQTIRAFLDGTGSEWDWDDFTSSPIADLQLDSIRKRAGSVELPVGPEEATELERLAAVAERLAKG